MPIYQYRCLVCGEICELIQKMDDPPIKECPFCSGKVRRMIGSIGIVFKGSGFHVNDYGRGSFVPASDSPPSSDKKTESKSNNGKKADSKE